MRKLTDNDMTNMAGLTVGGYRVEGVRIKRGEFSDSDHYGIMLGKNTKGHYVTWQFHLDENEKPTVYWGHYFMEDRAAAVRDFNNRDLSGTIELSSDYWDCECDGRYIHRNSEDRCPLCGAERNSSPDSMQNEVEEGTHFAEYPDPIRFKATITETLQLIIEVEAKNQHEAEQTVSDGWKSGKYILGAENFVDVGFEAVRVD
jgi:hypothetical protein